ncbi:hypothetical protein [Calycomorphotria hydatis]|uniref:Cytochrome c domain-containing protein n=1 Tax=Calycomorphotria hydatis TaxID=2528027 RepID=A0A517TAV8_9PLAN|nr:hypothetical protein [Calycomorphotria hydatis]QDT65500.1 hypothetical protein V22_27540 [Calycomorphotria hydatis]
MPSTRFIQFALCLAVYMLGAAFILNASSAEARPNYLKAFNTKYGELSEEVKNTKCFVCHESNKKVRNHYGEAFGGQLTEHVVRDEAKIDQALTKAESMPSSVEGKTFGDLISEGKLPE